MNGDRMEADHRRLGYRIFTDDEEVMLPSHKRDTEVPNNPGTDIHDRQVMSDTQREDWLLQTEPLHGARPRQTDRERPLVIDDRSGVSDLEAAGGVWSQKVDQNGIQAPLLPLERQILLEEEVTTPPRGGGRPATEPQGLPPRGGGGSSP